MQSLQRNMWRLPERYRAIASFALFILGSMERPPKHHDIQNLPLLPFAAARQGYQNSRAISNAPALALWISRSAAPAQSARRKRWRAQSRARFLGAHQGALNPLRR